jgi:hypothetical protein
MTEMPGVRAEFGKLQRSVCSPAQARLLWRSDMAADVRDLLPRIRVPTIVMARPTDELVPFDASAALAAAIPGAVLCTLPPGPHLSFDIGKVFVSEFLEFIGERPATDAIERELITVMFTDIVSSTERLSAQGDADWRRQLDMHDSIVDTILGKHGGVRAKHTGDGVFAVFTGPSKAARCALELVTALGTRGIPIRVGVHIGECERRGDDWSGLAVRRSPHRRDGRTRRSSREPHRPGSLGRIWPRLRRRRCSPAQGSCRRGRAVPGEGSGRAVNISDLDRAHLDRARVRDRWGTAKPAGTARRDGATAFT